MEQLHSQEWLTASSYMGIHLRISSYIRKPSSYITLQLLHPEFPYIWGNSIFFFISVCITFSPVRVSLTVRILIGMELMWHSYCPSSPGLVKLIKGSLTRDFCLQVFFINQCPSGPWVYHEDHFEFFRKFAEIFANEWNTWAPWGHWFMKKLEVENLVSHSL
jgi:hypothetical protein